MNNSDKLETLFKETFEHFEADVNPQVWANVQNGIKDIPKVSGASSAFSYMGKLMIGFATLSIIAGSIWYFIRPENKRISSSTNGPILITSQPEEALQNTVSPGPSFDPSSSNLTTKPEQESHSVQSLNQNLIIKNHPSKNISPAPATTNSSSNNSAVSSLSISKSENSSNIPAAISIVKSSATSQKDNITADNIHNADRIVSATIVASQESGDAPLTVTFGNQGIAPQLSWDFGDGISSKEISPVHTFDKPGNYVVTLLAKNAKSSASDKITITVKSIADIITIPNVFSPNADDKNDYFFFELKNIASIEVEIHDLAGHLIYKWNDLKGRWDGKNLSGADVPAGLYLYALRAIGTDGVVISKKGSVTLTRQ